jgi:hypothetical protein
MTTSPGAWQRRWAPLVAAAEDHERWECRRGECRGVVLHGALDAENHAVLVHGVGRERAREAIVRGTRPVEAAADSPPAPVTAPTLVVGPGAFRPAPSPVPTALGPAARTERVAAPRRRRRRPPRRDPVAAAAARPFSEAVRTFKRVLIEEALRETRGNRAAAARLLGVRRTSLARLIRDLGVAA